MTRYVVVRVWLADRPGSLGQLASKIGAVGGDLVGIDILERDGARAVDELTVELPDGFSPESLAAALSISPASRSRTCGILSPGCRIPGGTHSTPPCSWPRRSARLSS